jgi:hypothetical protein
MTTLIVYDAASGRITSSQANGADPELARKYQADGGNVITTETQIDSLLDVYVEQKIVRRPTNPSQISKQEIISDGKDAAVITDVPAGTAVQIFDGLSVRTETADGSAIEFTTGVPGEYRLHFECWPYVSWSYVIVAKAAS